MSYSVLLVEDNPHIMQINYEALMMEGYNVLKAFDAKQCRNILKKNDPDLIVLDIMLPDSDGIALCSEIKKKYRIPILFLSALGENQNIIDALKAGGDDYLHKPYDIGVLLARVEARIRAESGSKRLIRYERLMLDTDSLTALCEGKDLLLNQKEFQLLLYLVRNAGRSIPKSEINKDIWGIDYDTLSGALYTTVSRLNKKLQPAGLAAISSHGEYTLEEI